MNKIFCPIGKFDNKKKTIFHPETLTFQLHVSKESKKKNSIPAQSILYKLILLFIFLYFYTFVMVKVGFSIWKMISNCKEISSVWGLRMINFRSSFSWIKDFIPGNRFIWRRRKKLQFRMNIEYFSFCFVVVWKMLQHFLNGSKDYSNKQIKYYILSW